MLRRISVLFYRFAATHLHAKMPGYPLVDDTGATVGNIDQITLRGSRLQVEGWAQAGRVVLQGGTGRASMRPNLERTDVASALNIKADVGFFLDIPRPNLPPNRVSTLTLTIPGQADHPLIFALPEPNLRGAHRRLLPKFAGAVARSAPHALRWKFGRNPAHRARIKDLMGLNVHSPATVLNAALFAAPGPDDEPMRRAVTPITIILPVYNAFELLEEVIDRVFAHTDLPWHLIVVEDCSPDERVRPYLQERAAGKIPESGTFELLENDENLGFIGSVNRALKRGLELGHHVVLLNSDAFVPAGWATRLFEPMLNARNVATVTPMSNDAEIFSSPAICIRSVLEPGMADKIDGVAEGFAPMVSAARVPTGVGFCMAMNIDYLRKLPQLDTVFGKGYGEEVDWCRKAVALGGQHLTQPRLYVEHRGGESFGSEAKIKLVANNNSIIAKRYPGYDGDVAHFINSDPLITPRLALAFAWAGAWSDLRGAAPEAEIPVYVAHSLGGGAELYLQHRIEAEMKAMGRPSVILRVGGGNRWQVELTGPDGVISGATDKIEVVAALMAPLTRRRLIYSCGVGDGQAPELPLDMLKLGEGAMTSFELLFHDFYAISPSYTLLDSDGVFRGAVTVEGTDDEGHSYNMADGETITLAQWQERWGKLVAAADSLTVFSKSSHGLVAAAYPSFADKINLRPHELINEIPRLNVAEGAGRVVGILGNIGYQKGAAILGDLANALADSDTKIGLVVIGNTDPAYALPQSVTVHGDYELKDLQSLVLRYKITEWLIPSVWPETFSYTVHEAIATGLPTYAFDIGAQGDAVALAQNGVVISFEPGPELAKSAAEAIHRHQANA